MVCHSLLVPNCNSYAILKKLYFAGWIAYLFLSKADISWCQKWDLNPWGTNNFQNHEQKLLESFELSASMGHLPFGSLSISQIWALSFWLSSLTLFGICFLEGILVSTENLFSKPLVLKYGVSILSFLSGGFFSKIMIPPLMDHLNQR